MTDDTIAELQDKYEAEQDAEKKLDIRKEIHEALKVRSEFTFDLDNLPAVSHKWVDRGLVLSCEIGTHANHHIHKR